MPDIYEPSAIQQLPDGRFLVAEDEKTRPFSLVTIRPDGTSDSTSLITETLEPGASLSNLDDLEAITADSVGFIYAITSHSRSASGKERASRENLVRFRIEGDHIVEPVLVNGLKAALAAAHPLLASAAATLEAKTEGGLNIEALEMTPDQQRLLVGFRSPLLNQQALIASIENPLELFATTAEIHVSPRLDTLDLGGHGIRGMAYIPALGAYLVISGPVAKQRTQFRLWFWSGHQDASPRRVTVAGLAGFEHAEGVCSATIGGKPSIVIVSDDGSRKDGRAGQILLLDPAQLQIAS